MEISDELQAEVPGESQIVSSRQPQVVGEAALRALADCRLEPEFNYRDRKRVDRPAFQLSDERSI